MGKIVNFLLPLNACKIAYCRKIEFNSKKPTKNTCFYRPRQGAIKLNSYSIASVFYRFVACPFFEVTVHSLQFNAHDLKKRTCDKAIQKRLRSSMNSALYSLIIYHSIACIMKLLKGHWTRITSIFLYLVL